LLIAADKIERDGPTDTAPAAPVDDRPPAELLDPDADPMARYAFVMGGS
jgi:hypothetical protein